MKRTTWLIIALSYLAFAEVLSWAPVPDLSLCLIEPSHNEQPANHDDKKYCPAFHVGAALALEKTDAFLDRHDKSVIGAFTVVLALSTIGLWLSTHRLWSAGERQISVVTEANRISRQSLIASRRAWLSIDDVKLVNPTRFSEDGFVLRTEVTVKNFGQTPATSVWISFDSHYGGSDETFAAAQERILFKARNQPNMMGKTIFPSDPFVQREIWFAAHAARAHTGRLPT